MLLHGACIVPMHADGLCARSDRGGAYAYNSLVQTEHAGALRMHVTGDREGGEQTSHASLCSCMAWGE